MIGYAFFRDRGKERNEEAGISDSYKQVIIAGVLFVPEDFNADEAIYKVGPCQIASAYAMFDEKPIIAAEFEYLRTTGKRFMDADIAQVLSSNWVNGKETDPG